GALHVTDAKAPRVESSVPVEARRDDAVVAAIGTVYRVEDERAIFRAAAERTKLVHRPRESHRTGARNAPERWTQAGNSAARRWRRDRAERFAADREPHETGGSRRRRSGG